MTLADVCCGHAGGCNKHVKYAWSPWQATLHRSGSRVAEVPTEGEVRETRQREGVPRRFSGCEVGAPPEAHSPSFSEAPLLGIPMLSYKVTVLSITNDLLLALHLMGA